MTIYSTKVSAHYIARRQAAQAGGTQVNFLAGTVIVGDGNGAVPSISALVAAGGVLHEVWRGQAVVAVTVNEVNPAQVDVRCLIPAEIGGVEIGPFWVREFVVTDENGAVCIFGTTSLEKTTSAQGQVSDLSFIAAIGESDASVVILSAPTSNLVTMGDVQSAINAHHPTAEEPLYVADTTASGWLQRILKVRRAARDTQQIGVERPATDAEFVAGAPAAAPASQWPWPTLQQIKGALDAIWTQIGVLGTDIVNHAVTHDATLTGAGTAASPLSVVEHSVPHDATLTGSGTAASPLGITHPDGFGDAWIVTPATGFYDADTAQAIGITASAADIVAGTVAGITFVPLTDTSANVPFGGTWQTVAWVVTDASNSQTHLFFWKRIA